MNINNPNINFESVFECLQGFLYNIVSKKTSRDKDAFGLHLHQCSSNVRIQTVRL